MTIKQFVETIEKIKNEKRIGMYLVNNSKNNFIPCICGCYYGYEDFKSKTNFKYFYIYDCVCDSLLNKIVCRCDGCGSYHLFCYGHDKNDWEENFFYALYKHYKKDRNDIIFLKNKLESIFKNSKKWKVNEINHYKNGEIIKY